MDDTADRDSQAARLLEQGRTYKQIAEELGYSSATSAYRAASRALAAEVLPSANAMRREQLGHIDYLITVATGVMQRDHLTVSHGKIIRDEDGEPLLDDAPKLAAIDRIHKLEELRANLVGTKVPVQQKLAVESTVDERTAQLLAQIADAKARLAGEDTADGDDGP